MLHARAGSLFNTMADAPLMQEKEIPQGEVAPVAAVETPVVETAPQASPSMRERRAPRGREGRGRGRDRGGRERSEFDSVTIDVRRVARVMAGGRRFNFSVTIVIGDRKGRVGVGLGKGADTALAIEKATRDARRNMITVVRTESNSIPHDVSTKYASSTVAIMPSPGRGLVAGSAMRTVLELAGVTDVITKILSRTKNKLTIARATVAALKKLKRA
jgi:small subunit ribosomal protein S5